MSFQRSTFLAVLCLLVAWQPGVAAGKRYALLVGISDYRPQPPDAKPLSPKAAGLPSEEVARKLFLAARERPWTQIPGPLNDVDDVHGLLTARFGFEIPQRCILRDGQATRENIMERFASCITAPVEKGDVVVFYYAGHGSQIRNSASPELDRLDETIVPIDANYGALDIRDKELAVRFNAILDKGAVFTAIFDSCHSGSGARGIFTDQERALPEVTLDLVDLLGAEAAAKTGPIPEQRPDGALVLSASLDSETAGQVAYFGRVGGAFTTALVQVLSNSPGPLSAEQLTQRVGAILATSRPGQEPIVAGRPERLRRSIFGDNPIRAYVTTVAVGALDGPTIRLRGGFAHGLRVGSELLVLGSDGRPSSKACRLRITEVTSWSSAGARPSSPASAECSKALRIGDLLQIDTFSVDGSPLLRVLAPRWPGSLDSLSAATAPWRELIGDPDVGWVDDPITATPTHILRWEGGQWLLEAPDGIVLRSSTPPTPDRARAVLREHKPVGQKTRLLVLLPTPNDIYVKLASTFDTENPAVDIHATEATADYLLAGSMATSNVEFALMLPRLARRPEASGDVRLLTPARTSWVRCLATPEESDPLAICSAALQQKMIGISRVRGWMGLLNDASVVGTRFPYELELRSWPQAARGRPTRLIDGPVWEPTGEGGKRSVPARVQFGEAFYPVLKRRSEDLEHPATPVGRFYVFAIDAYGESQLVWPRLDAGDVENVIPVQVPASTARVPDEIPIKTATVTFAEPEGLETFVLLMTSEPLGDPSVLDSSMSRDVKGTSSTETRLSRLIRSIRGTSRSNSKQLQVPANWSLDAISVVVSK